jgi:hypothetical protein
MNEDLQRTAPGNEMSHMHFIVFGLLRKVSFQAVS